MTDRNETLNRLIEAARCLGATQARQIYGQYTIADGQVEVGLHKKIDQYRAALAQPEHLSLRDEAKRFALMQGGGGGGGREALQHALAQPEQDWDLLKATQESLREHQARIKELEAQIVQYVSLISEGKTLQEPVAWMLPDYGNVLSASEADGTGIYNIPLFTAPPKREWVGLTHTDLMKEFGYTDELLRDTAYRVEKILAGRNT